MERRGAGGRSSPRRAYSLTPIQMTYPKIMKGAIMKRSVLVVAIVGLLAGRAEAQSPYVGAASDVGATGRVATATPPGHTKHGLAGISSTTEGACGTCEAKHARGEKTQRLVDFLLYRPSIPCDSAMEPSGYVPPLTTGFPNRCSGTVGECGCSTGKPFKLRQHGSECNTCAASLGKPGKIAAAADRQAPARPLMSMPSTPAGMHTTLARPKMPTNAAPSATPNPLPPAVQQASPSTAIQSPYAAGLPGGFRVQPSNYYLPERP
jgi:hypothetical protein